MGVSTRRHTNQRVIIFFMSVNYPIASQEQTTTQEIMELNSTQLEVYRYPLELTLLKYGRGIKALMELLRSFSRTIVLSASILVLD